MPAPRARSDFPRQFANLGEPYLGGPSNHIKTQCGHSYEGPPEVLSKIQPTFKYSRMVAWAIPQTILKLVSRCCGGEKACCLRYLFSRFLGPKRLHHVSWCSYGVMALWLNGLMLLVWGPWMLPCTSSASETYIHHIHHYVDTVRRCVNI